MTATGYASWYEQGERRQDWTTPRPFFFSLDAEYGFTLDGAAEAHNALLPRFSSRDESLPWTGERVFCNPPWSDIAPFLELAATADLAVLLVPARTNAAWFHRALRLGATVRYFLGRPRFGGTAGSSPVDCLLLVFRRPIEPRTAHGLERRYTPSAGHASAVAIRDVTGEGQ